MIFLISMTLYSIVPYYYGARSLSLGYSSAEMNYDINSIFINAALLSELKFSLGGYQFESGNYAYKNFYKNLSNLSINDLKNYSSLNEDARKVISDNLRDIFGSKFGMYGFQANIPGFVVKRYGFSVSFFNLTIINPLDNGVFNNDASNLTTEDIENLNLSFIGLSYRKYSLAYGVDISKNISIGVSLHYLNGKVSIFDKSITDEIFDKKFSEREYAQYGWSEPEEKFGKIIVDVSLSSSVGNFFKVGIIVRNISNPKIETSWRELEIKERIIFSTAFRPDNKFGIYFDVDLKKRDLLYSGNEIQPISLGIERLFFNGKFIIRGGLFSDLTEHYLFGKNANILYCLGTGFNTGKFLVDAGIGLGSDGKLRSLAISGFYMIR